MTVRILGLDREEKGGSFHTRRVPTTRPLAVRYQKLFASLGTVDKAHANLCHKSLPNASRCD